MQRFCRRCDRQGGNADRRRLRIGSGSGDFRNFRGCNMQAAALKAVRKSMDFVRGPALCTKARKTKSLLFHINAIRKASAGKHEALRYI